MGDVTAVAGIIFGAALAVYILSHYDRRVKKVYALAAALVAALTALADFTSTQIPVSQECRSDAITEAQTCVTRYANDATPLVFFIMSIVVLIVALIEMSIEGMASVQWP